ncbi:MAG: DMT family transporter [Burkholderiaceae bacterium]
MVASHPLLGIAYKVLNALLVTLMLAVIKSVQGLPLFELMFFRSLFAALPVVVYLLMRGRLRQSMRTRKPQGHLARAVLSLLTMGLTFLAVRSLPLPEAVTLQYTQPLFVVALSAVLLSEPVGLFRWTAVALGFAGAMIITWPKLTMLGGSAAILSHAELVGAAAALAGAAVYASNIILCSRLVRTESSVTIVLWFSFLACAFLSLTMPFGWVVPSLEQIGLLAVAGLLGSASLIAMSEALRVAPVSTTAPFEYSSLLFAIGLGFVVFGDVPDLHTLIGGAIVIFAGAMILWWERARRSLPVVVEPV